LKALSIAMFGISISGSVLSAAAGETRPSGPTGFGNIPYGSFSQDAVRLNHGNGKMTSNNNNRPVLIYRTHIQSLTFDVAQNYDGNRKAVDAYAVSTSMGSPRTCIARFNQVLALLQDTYGQSGFAPLRAHAPKGEIRYTVLFEYDRKSGIGAELTSADPSNLVTGRNGGANGAGPCIIRLHYFPPGWAGRF
jgi:hypothetical protein